jgi:hypothetical protein
MPVSVTKTAVKDADGIGTSVTVTIFVPPIIVVREDGEQKISQGSQHVAGGHLLFENTPSKAPGERRPKALASLFACQKGSSCAIYGQLNSVASVDIFRDGCLTCKLAFFI